MLETEARLLLSGPRTSIRWTRYAGGKEVRQTRVTVSVHRLVAKRRRGGRRRDISFTEAVNSTDIDFVSVVYTSV
jgi:hypothetical protein